MRLCGYYFCQNKIRMKPEVNAAGNDKPAGKYYIA